MMRVKDIIHHPNFFFLLFFIVCAAYFHFVFDPMLYYHHHQPMFLLDRYFFRDFQIYPGGVSEWISRFIEQFFCYGYAGALIMGAFFSVYYVLVHRIILKLVQVKLGFILAFLPVAFLLALQNNHNIPFLLTIKQVVSLLFFLLYLAFPIRFKIFFIPLSVLIYYIVGGSFYLFFILLVVFYDVLFSKNYIMAGTNIVSFIILPFIAARFFFMITFTEAYLYILPFETYHPPFLFKPSFIYFLSMASLPFLLTILSLYSKFLKDKIHLKPGLAELLHGPAQWALVLLAGGLILGFSFRQGQKTNIQIDYYAERGQWQKIIRLSFQMTGIDRLAIFNVNRALYHTGKLLDNLFNYNQMLGTDGLFINRLMASQIALPASDLYFELGYINASQALAYEGQTKFKYNPRILKRLALTNLINGNDAAASKFLVLLNKSPVHRTWAGGYQKFLADRSLAMGDPLIRSKRALTPQFDFFIDQQEPNRDLVYLLRQNKNNKMAFEYLLAYYLLNCNPANLVDHLNNFKKMGYKKIPRHIEEALIMYKAISPPGTDIDLNDYPVSRQTMERFARFTRILYENRDDEDRAQRMLTTEFTNTYWYYLRYLNPKKTNIKLGKRKIDESIY